MGPISGRRRRAAHVDRGDRGEAHGRAGTRHRDEGRGQRVDRPRARHRTRAHPAGRARRSSRPTASKAPRWPTSPRRAGVTQPLVHYHFASKDALWRAAVDNVLGLVSQGIEALRCEVEGRSGPGATRVDHPGHGALQRRLPGVRPHRRVRGRPRRRPTAVPLREEGRRSLPRRRRPPEGRAPRRGGPSRCRSSTW